MGRSQLRDTRVVTAIEGGESLAVLQRRRTDQGIAKLQGVATANSAAGGRSVFEPEALVAIGIYTLIGWASSRALASCRVRVQPLLSSNNEAVRSNGSRPVRGFSRA
jgi:hypothetical protein